MFQGVVLVQMNTYFTSPQARRDRPIVRWMVIALGIFSVFKTITCLGAVWRLVVENFANPDVAVALPAIEWMMFSQPLTVGLQSFKCSVLLILFKTFVVGVAGQVFFTVRYYTLTGRYWLPVLVSPIIIVEAVSVIILVST